MVRKSERIFNMPFKKLLEKEKTLMYFDGNVNRNGMKENVFKTVFRVKCHFRRPLRCPPTTFLERCKILNFQYIDYCNCGELGRCTGNELSLCLAFACKQQLMGNFGVFVK